MKKKIYFFFSLVLLVIAGFFAFSYSNVHALATGSGSVTIDTSGIAPGTSATVVVTVSGVDGSDNSSVSPIDISIPISKQAAAGCSGTPTATLSGGGTYNVGDTVNYSWSSSGGDQWSSTYSDSNGGSGAWAANTSSGSTSGTLASFQAGVTYTITYTARCSNSNKSTSSTITVAVRQQQQTCSGSAPTCTSAANSCSMTNSGHQVCTNGTWSGCDASAPSDSLCPTSVNGVCGSDIYSHQAPGGNKCSAGSPSSATYNSGNGSYSWICYGVSGGTNASCSNTSAGIICYSDSDCGSGFTCNNPGMYSSSCVESQEQEQPTSYNITVTKTIGGSVSSSPAGISCGTTCVGNFTKNTQVTMTPTPDSAYWKFVGWSGACTGTGSCVVTVDGAKTVSAKFEPVPFKYGEF